MFVERDNEGERGLLFCNQRSDNPPIGMTLVVRAAVSKITRPISPLICKLPSFQKAHDVLVARTALEQMATDGRRGSA